MVQFQPGLIPVKPEDIEIPDIVVERSGGLQQRFPVNARPLRYYMIRLIRKLNSLMSEIKAAVNANEGSSIIVEAGSSLPTAEKYWNGRLVTTQESGGSGEDELWWCKWNGSAWAWEKII